jgi:peptidoglycan/xylan/chitin deacetylase (PgdA/CDA1 family)
MPILVAVIAGVFALAHIAPFPFLMEAFRPAQSLWHMDSRPGQPPTIYLTFDDGPNADWTPPLLDALSDTGVRATFFLIDRHITDDTAPIVRRIADEGHAIGLHSGTRRLMIIEPADLASVLQQAASRITAITAREPCRLFRPHAGWRSSTMYQALEKIDFRLAGWSWGMWDWDWWRGRDANRIAQRLARKASSGDIVVIHDGHHKDARADRRHAAETVRRLVPVLQGRGFTFETLCDVEASPDWTVGLAVRLPRLADDGSRTAAGPGSLARRSLQGR